MSQKVAAFFIFLAFMSSRSLSVESMLLQVSIRAVVDFVKFKGCGCVGVVANYEDTRSFNLLMRVVDIPKNFISFQTLLPKDVLQGHRIDCDRPLYLMFNDTDSQKVVGDLIKWTNAVLLFFEMNDPQSWLSNIYVPFDSSVYAGKLDDHQSVIFNELYQVAEYRPLHQYLYGTWTSIYGFLQNENRFRRLDLEGITFVTGSFDVVPTSYFTYNCGAWKLEGYIPQIWLEAADVMNFTSKNVRYEVFTAGSYNNGVWTGMVKCLLDKEIDVILIDFDLSAERHLALDFSHTLITTRYQVYMSSLGYNLGWTAPLKPFSKNVWYMILLLIFLVAFFIFICSMLTNDKHDLLTPVFFILRSLSQQGSPHIPERCSLRLIFVTIYLLSTILLPWYSASLVSSLTQRTKTKPFDSLANMMEGSSKIVVNKNTADHDFFMNTRNKLHKEIHDTRMEMMTYESDNNETLSKSQQMVDLICNNKGSSILTSKGMMDYQIQHVLYLGDCEVVTIDEPLPTIHQGLGFPKNFPYSRLFNYRFMQMHQSGILQRFKKIHFKPPGRQRRENFAAVAFSDLFTVFLILILGLSLSLILLLLENLHCIQKGKAI